MAGPIEAGQGQTDARQHGQRANGGRQPPDIRATLAQGAPGAPLPVAAQMSAPCGDCHLLRLPGWQIVTRRRRTAHADGWRRQERTGGSG